MFSYIGSQSNLVLRDYFTMKRKMLAARLDLADEISEIASRRGTLFDYVNEVLEQAIRACEKKKSLKEIIDEYEILEVHKKAGTTFTPKDILNYLISEVYVEREKVLQNLFYQTGKWYGIYLAEKFNDSVKVFIRLLQGRWGLNEVVMKETRDSKELQCVTAFLSQERTLLIRNFIEGALLSLGFQIQIYTL